MLDQVKTVQDLINLNNTNEEQVHSNNIKEDIMSQILDQEPKMGLDLTMSILDALKDFHMNAIEVLKKEEDYDRALTWAYDLSAIKNAMDILSEIDLWVFRNK